MMRKYTWLFAFSFTILSYGQTMKYTVQKGDNPSAIARKYGMSLEELYKLNPKLKNTSLNIGDVVKVKEMAKNEKTTKTSESISSQELSYIIVKPKQTIYGITKQYRINETDLRKLNPDLDSRMKIGSRLILPANLVKKYADNDAQNASYELQMAPSPVIDEQNSEKKDPVASLQSYSGTAISNDNFVIYTVQSGDTTFGIVNKFGVPLDQLIAQNPDLSGGLKTGMVLKLRKADKPYAKKDDGALNVVIMLPFGYEDNDTKYRSMSVDFLSGAKVALQRNTRQGMRLNVNVIDTGSETSFKKALRQINKDNTDLIIGPFFKSNVIEALDYVKDAKIPLVAPFANSEDLYGYDNLIIVETNDRFYADKLVEEIRDVYNSQKIFIVGPVNGGQTSYIKQELLKILPKSDINIVASPAHIKADTNMLTGKSAPVLAVLTTRDGNIANSFVDRMHTLAEEAPGTRAFSMIYDPIFEKKSNELGAVNFVYFMDRKINTQGSVEKSILFDYDQLYCKMPGKYAVIGFDVVNDMLTRENSKGEILKNMGREQTHLATKFNYERIQRNGAFVNTAFRIVRLQLN